jgi:hypothetical protein
MYCVYISVWSIILVRLKWRHYLRMSCILRMTSLRCLLIGADLSYKFYELVCPTKISFHVSKSRSQWQVKSLGQQFVFRPVIVCPFYERGYLWFDNGLNQQICACSLFNYTKDVFLGSDLYLCKTTYRLLISRRVPTRI